MGQPEFDTVLDICRNSHCRILLAVLATEQRTLTVTDLTRVIVKYNHGIPITEISEEVVEPIQLRLAHQHLPKIEAAGLIDYDPNRGHVTPTDRLEEFQPYIGPILDADPELAEQVEL